MKLLIAALLLAVFVPTYAGVSAAVEPPIDAPVFLAGKDEAVSNALNQVLRKQAGIDADVLDGTWLIIYGADPVPAEAVATIVLSDIGSIDILNRPNGVFKGMVVLSKRD